MQPRPYVFFDLDGVLVDSRSGIVGCVNAALVELGFNAVSSADVEAIIGPPLRIGFATLLRQQGHDARMVADCVALYRALYGTAAVAGTVLQPGVADMLEKLDGEANLSVATSKPLVFAEPILRALGIRDAFDVVVGPTPETDGETKTQTLTRAMRLAVFHTNRFIDSSAAFMVGDRSHDIAAAIANQIGAVGVTWGFGSRAELLEAGAVLVLSTPAELPPIVLGSVGA